MIMNMPDNSKDIETLKNTVGYTASKNLLENNYTSTTTTTSNGITFTVNDDGSVTVDGIATANTSIILNTDLKLPNGEYILSGCPEGGSKRYLEILYDDSGTKVTARDIGKGSTFVINDNNNTFTRRLRLLIESGTTVENLTFYPMIRKADITDDTYEPYGKSDVDSRLEELEELKSVLEWKLVGSKTSFSSYISLPTSWNEIQVAIISSTTSSNTNSQDCYYIKTISYEIIKQIKSLRPNGLEYFLETGTNDNLWGILMDIANNKICMHVAKGTTSGSGYKMIVYYR